LTKSASPLARTELASNLDLLNEASPETTLELLERIAEHETDDSVLTNLTASVCRLAPSKAPALFAMILRRIQGVSGVSNARSNCLGFFLNRYLAGNAPAVCQELQSLIDKPWDYLEELEKLLHEARLFFTAGDPASPGLAAHSIRRRALKVAAQIATSAAQEFNRLRAETRGQTAAEITPEFKKRAAEVQNAAATVANQLYFASGALDKKTTSPAPSPEEAVRRRFYVETRDIIDLLSQLGSPGIAFELCETLDFFIPIDPVGAFSRIGTIVATARDSGLQYEYMAAGFLVQTVSTFLIEHPSELRDPECRRALLQILDTFVAGGWTAAFQLTYRLSDSFR
jgi:hypothetical protein